MRNRLSIHTVFVPRENISHLKEWLVYHSMLGVEHFYLFDNSNSISRGGSTRYVNKYGINFHHKTRHMSDADINENIQEIISSVPAKVKLISWNPKDKFGNITYDQVGSTQYFSKEYSDETDWTLFIDIDEFVFSPANLTVHDIIEDAERDDISRIIFKQKKFLDRLLSKKKFAIDIYDCIEGIDTSGWAPKNLIRVRDMDMESIAHIHHMPLARRKTVLADTGLLRFNHDNVNAKLLEWMKGFYKTETDFSLNSRDDGMKRYRDSIHRLCGKKRFSMTSLLGKAG